MAALGGHPRTWLYVACLVFCSCGGSPKPAAVSDAGRPDASASMSMNAADGGVAEPDSGAASPQGPSDAGPGECQPQSCASLGARCGAAEDGCGGSLDCGACGRGELCEGNTCRGCAAKSCSELGWACGTGSDGCSGTVDCGACPRGAAACYEHTCCMPHSCPAGACGEVPDGCGGRLDCGVCPTMLTGKVCGRVSALMCLGPEASSTPSCSCELPFVCDPRNGSCCMPLTCADLCKQGPYTGSDGCGAQLTCETCAAPRP